MFFARFDRMLTSFHFLLFDVFILRERGREGEREGQKHPWVATTWDLARNPAMCPD